jgi:hypothetical protein
VIEFDWGRKLLTVRTGAAPARSQVAGAAAPPKKADEAKKEAAPKKVWRDVYTHTHKHKHKHKH